MRRCFIITALVFVPTVFADDVSSAQTNDPEQPAKEADATSETDTNSDGFDLFEWLKKNTDSPSDNEVPPGNRNRGGTGNGGGGGNGGHG